MGYEILIRAIRVIYAHVIRREIDKNILKNALIALFFLLLYRLLLG